jgi:predicted PurR-regulated permease PerM
VGSALVFVPGSIYAFATGSTFNGVALLIWGFGLVANIDNVLRIVINKSLGDTHPLITFLGIVVGLPLFGLTGLVIGPLMISFFVLLVKIYTGNYLKDEAGNDTPGGERKDEPPVAPSLIVPKAEEVNI